MCQKFAKRPREVGNREDKGVKMIHCQMKILEKRKVGLLSPCG